MLKLHLAELRRVVRRRYILRHVVCACVHACGVCVCVWCVCVWCVCVCGVCVWCVFMCACVCSCTPQGIELITHSGDTMFLVLEDEQARERLYTQVMEQFGQCCLRATGWGWVGQGGAG